MTKSSARWHRRTQKCSDRHTFLELLTCDCELNTHHTSSMNLTGPDFLKRKPQILETLRYGIEHFDMDELTSIRQNKLTL